MALKRIDENPTIADQLLIDIICPDADGCFLANPYKVDSVKIYYVKRSYGGSNYTKYDQTFYDEELKSQLDAAVKEACIDASEENLAEVDRLRGELNASAKVETFYFSDAQTVAVIGTDDFPAWLSTDTDNALIENINEDEDGNLQYGHFEAQWNPLGMREGDYFVCWTWTPNPSGEKLSSHLYFTLNGSTQLTTSIPTHFTDPEKYLTLLERYLPNTYKERLSSNDMTPEVMSNLNEAVADGFKFIEDMGNQIIDLIDSNAAHESLLPLLAGTFNLNLRSDDPTRWRRQIKRAVPLFKKKGTYDGLKEALDQAGIRLTRFARLWQVISKYTYQEAFTATDSLEFTLEKEAILPVDTNNFELYYRELDTDDWVSLSSDYVSLSTTSGITTVSWIGDTLSYEPIELSVGDSIRIVYQIADVPNPTEQSLEDYIRLLPLADQRDDRDQTYPLKNWNVRVIEEDDPLINSIISVKNPFYDPLVFGKIRTEFPYSENIYNMDEYNGSKRDSYNPCDIDKDFMDPCTACIGSKFVVDLEIENLTTDRISEAEAIIKEFVPVHGVLHTINLTGQFNEFIQSPVESRTGLMNISGHEFTISGNAQTIFGRSMHPNNQFKRTELANVTTVASDNGTASNEFVTLFSQDVMLDQIPLDDDENYTYLEVLSPSVNAGTYKVSDVDKNNGIVTGSVSEPLNKDSFTFRLSNERGTSSTATIYQDDVFKFSDSNEEFWKYPVKTQWDADHEDYIGNLWKVYIAAYGAEFEILSILSDGGLILSDPTDALPTSNTSNITYVLRDADGAIVATGTTGKLTITRRGRVDISSGLVYRGDVITVDDVRNLFDSYHNNGDNHYVKFGTTQYAFAGFVTDSTSEFYISGYALGDMVGATITIYQRLINGKKGSFGYRGMKLTTSTNYEVTLNIQNGENADSLYPDTDANGDPYTLQLENDTFFENFLILIDTKYYAIVKIDGNEIWLIGPDEDWTLSGTNVNFDILHYEKLGGNIPESTYPPMPGHDFDFLDRRGNEVITNETDEISMLMLATAFNTQSDGIVDSIAQQEGITFSVNTRD